MAEWKKIIFSGSAAELTSLNVGAVVNDSEVSATQLTGSFTGSFQGDGSGLTGLSSGAITTYTNAANDRLVTSVNSTTVNSEANLTFDGNTLNVIGAITNDSEVSATQLTGSFTGSFTGDGSALTGVGGGSPGGSDTEIQYNNSTAFGGDSTFTFNSTTKGISATSITSSFKGSLAITASFSTDHTVDGITTRFTAAETITFGQLVHVTGSGQAIISNASASVAVPTMMMMAETTVAANDSAKFLLTGFARDDTWNWTPGQKLYLSNVSGEMTQSAPSNTDDTIQVVGYAIHADKIYFNPSLDTIILG